MEEGTREGSAYYENLHLYFSQVYSLKKNLILFGCYVQDYLRESLYFDFYFQFYSSDSFASGGCIVGHPVNVHLCVFKDRKYGSCRKIEILNHQDSIVVFWITEACIFKLYNLFYSYSEYLFLSLYLGLKIPCVMRSFPPKGFLRPVLRVC